MAVTLPEVVEELLSEMAAAVRDGARIPDEHLSSLKFVFGSSAIQALDLVDRESVTLISSPSGRRVYQVLGSSGKTYTCMTSCHYCSCPAFAFSVLRKSDSLLCKHLLAIYLSQVMRNCQQLSVSDKQLTDLLLMEDTRSIKGAGGTAFKTEAYQEICSTSHGSQDGGTRYTSGLVTVTLPS
ncbi:LOW QUALITY PROTEIN: zinc finger SWIM domain-containing protein 7 isoform X1 [Cricetulus griseus]|uniref:LOW QUALITY PROTEIN: zinc finger SWIM domain-containing protein 7 isoform X1 n=1 Tax=Cricetulus griseus TaxID=10029 RepID=UPI0015C2D1A0|nr:LOW QUALITY PROTEIN: zinc finger SWIM domain-containing protein 7 isoform X1 [Cricetulus griseus]